MEYATLLNMDRQGRIVIPIQVQESPETWRKAI